MAPGFRACTIIFDGDHKLLVQAPAQVFAPWGLREGEGVGCVQAVCLSLCFSRCQVWQRRTGGVCSSCNMLLLPKTRCQRQGLSLGSCVVQCHLELVKCLGASARQARGCQAASTGSKHLEPADLGSIAQLYPTAVAWPQTNSAGRVICRG